MLDLTATIGCPLRSVSCRWVTAILVLMVCLASETGLKAQEPVRSSPAAKAAYTAAAALQNRGAWDLASEAWGTLLRDHPGDPLAAKGRYYLGLCRLQEGKWPEAAVVFRAVIETAGKPGGADPETVTLARFELGRGAFAEAQKQRTPEAYREAAGALQACLAGSPGPEQASEASYLLAESLWLAGDRQAAIDGWQRFITDRATSPRLPAVLYALGVAQAEIGDVTAAGEIDERFGPGQLQSGHDGTVDLSPFACGALGPRQRPLRHGDRGLELAGSQVDPREPRPPLGHGRGGGILQGEQ